MAADRARISVACRRNARLLAIAVVAIGAFDALGAACTPLAAQEEARGLVDSSLTFSLGVRSWLAVAGQVDGPVAGLRLRTRYSWLLLRVDANAAAVNRAGNSYSAPSLLDGALQVATVPVRIGNAGADAQLGLERDAFDPTPAWTQQSASLRLWYGTASQGVWGRAGAGAPVGWHATPTSAELQLGGWMTRGATQWSASVERTATGRLAAVGADSASIDPTSCRLDYDARRPIQQYRTVCPQQLQSLDAGAAVAWTVGALRVRLFAAHRMLGSTAFNVPIESWAGGSLEYSWSENVRFTLDADRRPTDIVRGLPAHDQLAIGMRLAPWSRGGRDEGMSRRTDIVSDRHIVRFRLGAAATADVRGDFTDWKTVPLTRDGDEEWALPPGIARGVYTLSVRIDGGPWHPPPGLPTASDGFGGTVGVLVIP